ncbi:ABC-type branched-chain amino acid transport system, substrate-binding protein [Desulfocicer vacuolatum DSM 3385]|uniref:ABC-type branched-chain amino acid transport system, substrate-binding protein n=1 Tax=Desulfocicer vacuolatum DSM 3385 TaxID=1121400 RepID=A0A1W1YL02_9BACT|nr:ABC transporter substrate-binding protein [Desulfocicer vacuolatum]SMC36819.1 ABC-type branched-chain amino acid transport system, substrate-binding protein [Desulfocicer vacuolatum DSM 3385]
MGFTKIIWAVFYLCCFISNPLTTRAFEPVKIAVILAKTGIAAQDNVAMGQAATMAVEEINEKGGLLGSPVELILIDNKSTSLGSKAAAMEAVQRQVTGVIGASWSSHSLAMAPVLQRAGIPMITPVSTMPGLTEIGNYIFRVCFTDELQAKAMASFATKDLNAHTAVVLHNVNEQYSGTLANYFSQCFIKNNGKVLFHGYYTAKSVDFTDMLATVKDMAPDIVFIPGYSRDSALVIRQAVEMGITATFLGGDAWTEKMFDYAGNALNGSYTTASWHKDFSFPGSRHLKALFRKKYTNTPVYNSDIPLTYDAMGLLAHAVKKAGTLNTEKIRDVLAKTVDYHGATGDIAFDGKGNPLGKEVVIVQLEGNTSRFVKSVKEETVKIAAIYALSGKAAESNKPSLEGVINATNDINASGGISDKKIKLHIFDNQSTPIGAKMAAKEAVAKGARAIIGADWSDHSLAVARVAQAAGVPMITNVSTNQEITKTGNYIFRVCFIDSFQGKVMGKFALEDLSAATAVIFTNITSAYSMGLSREFQKTFEKSGGKILFTAPYKTGLKKYKKLISQTKNKNPDVIFFSGHDESGFLARQIQRSGVRSILLGGDDWDTKSFLSKGGKYITKGYYCTHWSMASKSPVSLDFVKRYHTMEKIPSAFALSHDAVLLLANAMNRAGKMDRKSIRDALQETAAFEGITGKIVFNKNRNPVKNAIINEINHGQIRYFKTISP